LNPGVTGPTPIKRESRVQIGYKLSSEDHDAPTLVAEARRAEERGFAFGLISDHYLPWSYQQGESPFVWAVLGGIAEATTELPLITGVTCPTVRIHPAIVAQAAATVATMMPGRFQLGVGSGEHLNEHVLGDRWPPTEIRHEMLEDAVGLIRRLFDGDEITEHGRHYTVENAQLVSRPDEPPPILVAAGGPNALELATRIGDGLIATSPDADRIDRFQDGGDQPRPVVGEIKVAYDPDEAAARRDAMTWWPNAALAGELGQELPHPRHFEQAAQLISEDRIGQAVVCGPDPERHADALRTFADAGFTHLAVHQVVPGVEGFWDFYTDQVLPRL
jgi:G6PDH family F420-dependent oxidoreductase